MSIRNPGKVYCRIANNKDIHDYETDLLEIAQVDDTRMTVNTELFVFNYIFQGKHCQNKISSHISSELIEDSINDDQNKAFITYGQIGSGKTFSLLGNLGNSIDGGIIVKVMKDLFGRQPTSGYQVEIIGSCYEIHNEQILDLLTENSEKLKILEKSDGSVEIKDLTECILRTETDFQNFLMISVDKMHKNITNGKYFSNRSHVVYNLKIKEFINGNIKCKNLLFIELAGYQKTSKSLSSKMLINEAKSINVSLSLFKSLVCSFKNNQIHFPFRNSKLTRLFKGIFNPKCSAIFLLCIQKYINADGKLDLELSQHLYNLYLPSFVTASPFVPDFSKNEKSIKNKMLSLITKSNPVKGLTKNSTFESVVTMMQPKILPSKQSQKYNPPSINQRFPLTKAPRMNLNDKMFYNSLNPKLLNKSPSKIVQSLKYSRKGSSNLSLSSQTNKNNFNSDEDNVYVNLRCSTSCTESPLVFSNDSENQAKFESLTKELKRIQEELNQYQTESNRTEYSSVSQLSFTDDFGSVNESENSLNQEVNVSESFVEYLEEELKTEKGLSGFQIEKEEDQNNLLSQISEIEIFSEDNNYLENEINENKKIFEPNTNEKAIIGLTSALIDSVKSNEKVSVNETFSENQFPKIVNNPENIEEFVSHILENAKNPNIINSEIDNPFTDDIPNVDITEVLETIERDQDRNEETEVHLQIEEYQNDIHQNCTYTLINRRDTSNDFNELSALPSLFQEKYVANETFTERTVNINMRITEKSRVSNIFKRTSKTGKNSDRFLETIESFNRNLWISTSRIEMFPIFMKMFFPNFRLVFSNIFKRFLDSS